MILFLTNSHKNFLYQIWKIYFGNIFIRKGSDNDDDEAKSEVEDEGRWGMKDERGSKKSSDNDDDEMQPKFLVCKNGVDKELPIRG